MEKAHQPIDATCCDAYFGLCARLSLLFRVSRAVRILSPTAIALYLVLRLHLSFDHSGTICVR